MKPHQKTRQCQSATQNCGERPIFFYMPFEAYGEFCQWFPLTFIVSCSEILSLVGQDVSGHSDGAGYLTFNCAEQFMMFCKAGRFRDTKTQLKIMNTDSPKEQKRLGKLIEGFVDAYWDVVKSNVVRAGNIAKFSQSSKLKGKLLATGSRLLCEASSRDRVWGIGYTAKHAMSFQGHWGENRLGKALMEVREHLRGAEEGERAATFK